MKRLIAQLRGPMTESCKLNVGIGANLEELGYGG
mgnify:CR=1 FL=1